MSTFTQRYEATKVVILNETVTVPEAVVHMYYFLQFERQVVKAERAQRKCKKYSQILSDRLTVFAFRQQMQMSKL